MDVVGTAKDQLPLLLLLVLPGFISIRVFEMLVPGRSTSTGREALEALAYGAVNFGIWAVPVLQWLSWLKIHPARAAIVAVVLLIVSPAALAIFTRLLLTWRVLGRWIVHPAPTAWDYLFGLRRSTWVRVHLKGGRQIGGFFGTRSFAGSDPSSRDLYIEELWQLDNHGRFQQIVPNSLGCLIQLEECEFIEMIGVSGEQ